MASEKLEIEIDLVEDKNSTKKVFDSVEKQADETGKAIGKKTTGGFFTNLKGSISGLLPSVNAATVAVGALTAVTFKSIQAANVQEDAINSLNSALRINNEFTKENSEDLQDYASSLQQLTRFGDEAILQQLAFAQSLGASKDQSKLVVGAAADLAAALNIDLNSATRNVAKTLGGFAGELGEVIPELKSLSTEQLQAGEGVELLAKRFSGAANESAQTFSGSLDKLSNNLGDVFESIGFLITKQPILKGAIDALNTSFVALNSSLQAIGGTPPDILGEEELVNKLKNVSAELEDVDAKIKDFQSRDRSAFFGLTTTFAGEIEELKELKNELIIQDLELNTQLNEVRKQANDQAAAQRASALQKEKEDQQKSLEALAQLGILTEEILIQNLERETEILNQAYENGQITEDQLQQFTLQKLQQYEDEKLKIAEQGNKKRQKEQFNANKVFANLVASGTAELFSSIYAGENAFKALGNFVLNTLGDLATQTGQFYIAEGIAIEALNSVSGTGAVAAGVALVALGQLFKSFSGSGGGSVGTVPTGSGSAVATTSFSETSPTDQLQQETPQAGNQINITVEGNILDRRQSGLELVEIINESINSDNVVINQSFA